MNYSKIYEQLVTKRRISVLHKSKNNAGAVESHHIVPLCLDGLDIKTNIVNLTPREHYICHLLLWKMHPKHLGLNFALMSMTDNSNSTNQRKFKYNARLYQKAKLAFAERMKDVPSPIKGKKLAFNMKTQTVEYASKDDFALPYIVQIKMLWICNDSTNKEKQIPNLFDVPIGWHKGRRQNISTSHKGLVMISNPQTLEVQYVPKGTTLPDGWKYGKSRPLNMAKRHKYFEIQKQRYAHKAKQLFEYFIQHNLSFADLAAAFPEIRQYKSSNSILQLFARYLQPDIDSKTVISAERSRLKKLGIKPFAGRWSNSKHGGTKNFGNLHKVKEAIIGKFNADSI